MIQIARVRVYFANLFAIFMYYFFVILIVTIYEGRTVTRFQEHFPGFLTYRESEAVKVLSIVNINGIDFWEAEVSHDKLKFSLI